MSYLGAIRFVLTTDGSSVLDAVSYTHLRAHETDSYLVCRLLLEKKKTMISIYYSLQANRTRDIEKTANSARQ